MGGLGAYGAVNRDDACISRRSDVAKMQQQFSFAVLRCLADRGDGKNVALFHKVLYF